MKKVCSYLKILIFIGFFFAVQVRGVAQDSVSEFKLILDPEDAGVLQYDDITDSLLFLQNGISQFNVLVDYNAGWMPVDTEINYNSIGIPVEVIIKAEKSPESIFGDSLVISEVFFCAELVDSLSDWFELTNFSSDDLVLSKAFIQTIKGKNLLEENIMIPAKSCVQLLIEEKSFFNIDNDSLVLVDSNGCVISSVFWDVSKMNLPVDSLFSLEIIDVFDSEREVSNWEIVYGVGRAGKLPVKYADKIAPESIWNWLQFVVWAVASLILVVIIALSFRKVKR